jgi:Arc/MetJ-type ribon-helix-helix transcriptional regulator
MRTLSKRTTVYLDPDLHKALRLKSIETSRSVSDVVNDAVRESLAEDADDLAAFEERKDEPVISFEALLKELKRHGKI